MVIFMFIPKQFIFNIIIYINLEKNKNSYLNFMIGRQINDLNATNALNGRNV